MKATTGADGAKVANVAGAAGVARGMPPAVLVFSGSDPSGGAGMQADITAIAALGAHPFSVPTVLTVQDNARVFSVHPLPPELVRQQAQVLIERFRIDAVKLGVIGNRANAEVIAALIAALRRKQPGLPVVLDPVLSNGGGDALSSEEPMAAIAPLFGLASVLTPNRIEAQRLCGGAAEPQRQAQLLLVRGPAYVLLKGGHGPERDVVLNRLFGRDGSQQSWSWPRLSGEFHGSGCTLAAALAALLAAGESMPLAVTRAQAYCQRSLEASYALAAGQRFPNRTAPFLKEVQ
jgi:hydroxymethylpyrimidine/phosphomethylpyrimidine kinase